MSQISHLLVNFWRDGYEIKSLFYRVGGYIDGTKKKIEEVLGMKFIWFKDMERALSYLDMRLRHDLRSNKTVIYKRVGGAEIARLNNKSAMRMELVDVLIQSSQKWKDTKDIHGGIRRSALDLKKEEKRHRY